MKPLALVLAVATAQSGSFVVTDAAKNVRLSASRAVAYNPDPKSGIIRFDLDGGVDVSSKSQGIVASAPRMKGTLVNDPMNKKAKKVSEMVATGAFRLDRTSTEKGGVVRTTKIRSTGASYASTANDAARVTLDQDAVINDDKGPRSIVLTGDHGQATLRTVGEKTDLQTATLVGSVKIRAVIQGSDGKVVPYTATGDRMEAAANADGGSTVVLTGDLKFVSEASEGGEITGATKAVIKLDPQGEVVSSTLSSGGDGFVKARYRPKKKGQS